ncbi:hypothetical protein [Stenotrophomonas maltophilia]|uniref:hypothetical protein n=1 Tax=Stenotrophomonas maltophilia TaxID=40324 RepID=UPI000C148B83|nr:hypothetical protein [Stenotrophomonas maltophilia]
MRRTAFPFLVLSDEAVTFEGWYLGDKGMPLEPARELLEDWDYARNLTLRASIRLDWQTAADVLEVDADSLVIVATLHVGTGQGRLPRRTAILAKESLSKTQTHVVLTAELDGSQLSSRITGHIHLSLGAGVEGASALSPRLPGSRLWSTDFDVLIEDGGSSRFPISSLSFKDAFPESTHVFSPWYLEWRPSDLHSDFSSSVSLYVNEDEEEFHKRFHAGDRLTVQSVIGGVAFELCSVALMSEEGFDIDTFEEGSVGAVISHWLVQAFGQTVARSAKGVLERDPGAFFASMLSAMSEEP